MSYYVHAVPGRMRIKIPPLKGDGKLAAAIERLLLAMEGIESACANTLTGSVVINYAPAGLDSRAILAALAEAGYIDADKTATMDEYFQAKAARAGKLLARALCGIAMDQALAGSQLSFLSVLL